MTYIFIFFFVVVYGVFLSAIRRGVEIIFDGYKYYSNDIKKISVIVPFRNEQNNVLTNFVALLSQDYPVDKFEVIYIDDNSTDNSYEVLDKLIKDSGKTNFRLIKSNSGGDRGHKKQAIAKGISVATGEIIATTDADCSMGEKWLKSIASAFDEETVFVAGPVKLEEGERVFTKLQALEFGGLMLSGAGLIGIGKPLICSAANLAYRKDIFIKLGGYSDNENLSSGDDELLMQKIASRKLGIIKFLPDKEAVVSTMASESVGKFFEQRKRWSSKSLYYENKMITVVLMLIFLALLSIPVQLFLGVFYIGFLFSGLSCLLLKMILDRLVLNKGIDIFYDFTVMRYFYLAEILHIPYLLYSSFMGLFGNYTWKERKLER